MKQPGRFRNTVQVGASKQFCFHANRARTLPRERDSRLIRVQSSRLQLTEGMYTVIKGDDIFIQPAIQAVRSVLETAAEDRLSA
jgi:hypothetical protein